METTKFRTRVEEERNWVCPENVKVWVTEKVLCNESEIKNE